MIVSVFSVSRLLETKRNSLAAGYEIASKLDEPDDYFVYLQFGGFDIVLTAWKFLDRFRDHPEVIASRD